jgi:ribosomal protein S12 methylthiotransferase
MGCLSQRYLTELQGEMPEVDGFYGKFNYENLLTDLGETAAPVGCIERHLTTPAHYAYLKISEGCSRTCSYCAIPIITGKHRSRPMDEVVQEARMLVSKGVKEIQLIAQDLSYYGKDRYKSLKLPELVSRLSDIPELKWLRLHYTYPYDFPMELLPVMRERENVCNYLDMALQHISDHMLLQMRRKITKAETLDLLARIREEVPGIHLRTTLMVGHPGETEADFHEMLDFVQKNRFERLGAFVYSEEEGTFAARRYTNDVPESVKQARLDELMLVQQGISESINRQKIGQELAVVIDRVEGDLLIGRTEFDSPEVDPEIHLPAVPGVLPGTFGRAVVTDAGPYDLSGKWINLT